jgi:DNA repair protein RadC
MIEKIKKVGVNFLYIREASGMVFHDSDEIYENMKAEAKIDRECMWVIHSINGRIIEKELVAMGNGNTAISTPREIFKSAIINDSTEIILVHNHPSGDHTPSDADIETSCRYLEAGNILGIALLDFLVIGTKGYTSFAKKHLGGF